MLLCNVNIICALTLLYDKHKTIFKTKVDEDSFAFSVNVLLSLCIKYYVLYIHISCYTKHFCFVEKATFCCRNNTASMQ